MTLIESLVALAIASTATAVAVPSLLRAQESYVLTAAASDVASKLHAARIHAVTESRDCRLQVDSQTTYVVECQNPGSSAWLTVESAEVPRGIAISANAKPEFHRRGNVSPTATISVWNERGASKRIVINIAGRVRIQ